jgi:hypothetical protein
LLTWHRRRRATRTATHLTPAIHPHLHDRLRLAQLDVRHPHPPYPPPGIPRQRHPVRSGWFIESAITELAVTLVLRALMTGLLGTPHSMNRATPAGPPRLGARHAAGPRLPAARKALDALARRIQRSRAGPGTHSIRSDVVAAAADASDHTFATVHLTGGDPYSFTAPLLAWAAANPAADGVRSAGALGPVEAFGTGSLESAPPRDFTASTPNRGKRCTAKPALSRSMPVTGHAKCAPPREGQRRPELVALRRPAAANVPSRSGAYSAGRMCVVLPALPAGFDWAGA